MKCQLSCIRISHSSKSVQVFGNL